MSTTLILLMHATYTGIITGILIALPMGPAGIESVRWTIIKGFKQGITLAIGTLITDAFDLALINFGILDFIKISKKIEVFIWVLSGLAIFIIGFKGIMTHRKALLSEEDTTAEMAKSMTRPFLTGFLINFTNLGTHFFWLTLSSTVFSIWRSAGKLPFLVFSVSIMIGLFICILTINLCVAKGLKAYLSNLTTKISHLLAYGLALLGIGFITYGIYKSSDFI